MKPILSILIPCYNEEGSLKKLYADILKNVTGLIDEKRISDYEIVFVSDGCTDKSEEIIKQLIKKDNHVRLIVLRRNFGKSKALQIGFKHVKGDIIITMDADLQDDAKEISRFLDKLDEGFDLVSGWKHHRHDPLEKTLPSKFFNFVTAKLSGIAIHDFNCGFKAYRREVIENVSVYGEFHRYIPVLAKRYGFKVAEIEVKHHERQFGKSKFGFERYLRGFFDAISAVFLLKYCDKPMYFFGKAGMALFSVGFLICMYLTCIWFGGESIGHRPLLILGVLFVLVGVQLLSLGLIANIIVDNAERKSDNRAYIKEIV